MIDLIPVIIFVIYSIWAGFRSRREASRNLRDFFLAGGKVTGWKAGVSMAATQYAADTPLLATGLVATGGIYLLWRFWIYGFAYLLIALVFAECWRHSRVLTDAELTELRYTGKGALILRVLKAIYYGTIVNCFFLAMVLTAAVRIAEVFLPWHKWLPDNLYNIVLSLINSMDLNLGSSATGIAPQYAAANGLISIFLIVLFVLLYSAVGGLRAVVMTDVMQFLFIMVGTVIYAIIIVIKAGGLSEIGARLTEIYGQVRSIKFMALLPRSHNVLFPFLMLIGMQGLFWISSDGSGYLAQRSMACRSDHDARVAGILLGWLQILVRSLFWLLIGIGLLILYPFTTQEAASKGFAAARELTFVLGIRDFMPVGLKGIMVTGILAALASTVDTHLNWGASYWSNDIYKRLICKSWLKRKAADRELVMVARFSNIIILIISLFIMFNLGSIQATWFISLVFGAGIGGVLMLRWLWDRINLYSEIAAIVMSLIIAPIILVTVDREWIRLAIMVLTSLAAAIGITFITPSTAREVLQNFHQKVRPFGWWYQSGAGTKKDLDKFIDRLKYIIFMTISLFLILIGFIRILIPVSWISPFWGWITLLLGLFLIPIWWPAIKAKTFNN